MQHNETIRTLLSADIPSGLLGQLLAQVDAGPSINDNALANWLASASVHLDSITPAASTVAALGTLLGHASVGQTALFAGLTTNLAGRVALLRDRRVGVLRAVRVTEELIRCVYTLALAGDTDPLDGLLRSCSPLGAVPLSAVDAVTIVLHPQFNPFRIEMLFVQASITLGRSDRHDELTAFAHAWRTAKAQLSDHVAQTALGALMSRLFVEHIAISRSAEQTVAAACAVVDLVDDVTVRAMVQHGGRSVARAGLALLEQRPGDTVLGPLCASVATLADDDDTRTDRVVAALRHHPVTSRAPAYTGDSIAACEADVAAGRAPHNAAAGVLVERTAEFVRWQAQADLAALADPASVTDACAHALQELQQLQHDVTLPVGTGLDTLTAAVAVALAAMPARAAALVSPPASVAAALRAGDMGALTAALRAVFRFVDGPVRFDGDDLESLARTHAVALATADADHRLPVTLLVLQLHADDRLLVFGGMHDGLLDAASRSAPHIAHDTLLALRAWAGGRGMADDGTYRTQQARRDAFVQAVYDLRVPRATFALRDWAHEATFAQEPTVLHDMLMHTLAHPEDLNSVNAAVVGTLDWQLAAVHVRSDDVDTRDCSIAPSLTATAMVQGVLLSAAAARGEDCAAVLVSLLADWPGTPAESYWTAVALTGETVAV